MSTNLISGFLSAVHDRLKTEVARNTGAPSRSGAIGGRYFSMNAFSAAASSAADPAHRLARRRFEPALQAVFVLQPVGQHVELQRADDADDGLRAVDRREQLHHALLRHLVQRVLAACAP